MSVSEELKLMLQYFDHLMRRADSLEKILLLGKIGGKRKKGLQRTRWLDKITNSVAMNLNQLQEIVKDKGAWHAAVFSIGKFRAFKFRECMSYSL